MTVPPKKPVPEKKVAPAIAKKPEPPAAKGIFAAVNSLQSSDSEMSYSSTVLTNATWLELQVKTH